MSHSNSFILPGGEYTGNFNKNNEKIDMLQFDLETTKDTIIKLKSELISKNKEINSLKVNKDDKSLEHLYTLKVIATVLKLVDGEPSKEVSIEQKNENENNNNSNVSNNNNANGNEKKEEQKDEKENNNSNNNANQNSISKKLPPISNRTEQSPKKGNKSTSKELSYISSLKLQINGLKELLSKKDEEIKEIQKNKTTLNYSKLQNNFERNIAELSNIKKQNELMKTKIEDVTNLLYIEKEGNKSLKSKLQVFQSSFKDFQENSDKKNMDLEAKLVQAHEKERDCRIFHIRRASGPELQGMGSRNSSRVNLDNDLDDNKRLKIAEEEIKNIKKDIENMNKDIKSKNDENDVLKENKIELEKKVNEMKDRNNKLKTEINSMNKNVKDLKNNKNNLEKENKNLKNKYKTSNNDLTNEQNKITKIKENLNKKENEILELKKQIEKLKQSNNFKDGMFFTSIGAKGKTKNDNLADVDVNIDEELAQIESKYKMINEQNKKNNEEKKIDEEEEIPNKNKENKEEEKVDNNTNKNENKDDLDIDKEKKDDEKI